jgi:ABC-type transport system substrate-binding protein
LLHEAGYSDGLPITLIATEDLEVQATVVGKMLEQVGLTVELQLLNAAAYNQKTWLSRLDQPPERQSWDIALASQYDFGNFPVFFLYHYFALDGQFDWVNEQPALRQLYEQILHTVDQKT